MIGTNEDVKRRVAEEGAAARMTDRRVKVLEVLKTLSMAFL